MAISDKLTYLNTTKTKIREGLNSLGADLDTEDTFRSYADAIEGIYEDYPKITGEGESLSLDNTKQASMQINYKGNTSQNGTPTPSSPIPINVVSGDNAIDICGKNLFKGYENMLNGFLPSSGNYPTTNSSYPNARYQLIELKAGESITTSNSTNSQGRLRCIDKETNQVVDSIGTSTNDYYTSTINYFSGFASGTITAKKDFIVGIMLLQTITQDKNFMVEKSTTATTYEPYIGKSYPIYLGVEELFDKDNANILNAYFETSTPNLSSNDRARTLYIECLPNTTYTIEKLRSQQFNVGCTNTQPVIGTTIQKIENGPLGDYNGTTKASYTYTTNSTAKYLLVRYAYTTQVDLNLMLSSIKIQKGNKINHASTTQIELGRIGNYVDFIFPAINGNSYYDSLTQAQKDELTYGSWYLHKEIGKVVLNGSENWATISYGTNSWRLSGLITPLVEDSKILIMTTKFQGIAKNDRNTDNSVIYVDGSALFLIRNTPYITKAEVQSGMSGQPVYYVLATPTNTPIEDTTLIEQLEESKLSYISQTNISQENNDLPFILDVKALRGE